jgi:hypothetical protein
VEWSAGIKVLHYLCDELNRSGHEAFLVLHGARTEVEVSKNLFTPVLTKELLGIHIDQKKLIVAVYPETVIGNPLKARHVIRWLLNYPRLLGGARKFSGEIVIAYSENLSREYEKNTGVSIKVLFVPAIRSSEIERIISGEFQKQKTLNVIYAQKYRALGGIPDREYDNFVEVTRFGKKAPNRTETLNLIRRASVLHVYENSTVISEACLLGTPVLCHKNEYFFELIASTELPFSGVSWQEKELNKPDMAKNLMILKNVEKNTTLKVRQIIKELEFNVTSEFVEPVIIPRRGVFTRHSVNRGLMVFTKKGPLVFARFLRNYIGR